MTGVVALLAAVRGKLLALIIWTLSGAAVAGCVNLLLPVVYEASAKVFIATPYWNDSTALADPNVGGGKDLAYGDEFTQQRMASYARLVTTSMVTGRVTERLGLGESGDDLAKKLSGRAVPETVMLQVSAQDASPAKAAAIADEAAQQTINVIKAVERPPYNAVSPVQPVLFEPASVPSRPLSPRTLMNIVCGAIIGLLLGLSYVVMYATAREASWLSRLRGADGVPDDELSGLLGVLNAASKQTHGGVDTDARLLRIEVTHQLGEAGTQSLMVTSPRTTAAIGSVAELLAMALGEAGSPTVVVRTDFSAEQEDSKVGLATLLNQPWNLESAIQTDEDTSLCWIPAGVAPENPTKELTSTKMRDLLGALASRYRYVIVVGPPTLELPVAVDIASLCGASILVDLIPRTTAGELRESKRLLQLARGMYLGRVAVVDRSFSSEGGGLPFEHRRTSASSESNTDDGGQWNY